MGHAGWLMVAWVTAFAANVAPAFTPPTWAILAAFRVWTDVPLVPLTVGGAAGAALGRWLLGLGAARVSRYLPERDRANAEALGAWFTRHRRFRLLFVAGYTLGPFPSNVLFIAAGAGRMSLRPIVLTFFVCRAASDTLWVWLAHRIVGDAGDALAGASSDWRALTLDALAVVLIALVFRLPWGRWLD